MRICVLLAVAVLPLGCLPSSETPGGDPSLPPSTCGDGVCQLENQETCENCPGDCSCCHGIFATGLGVSNPSFAVGPPDGQFAMLAESSALEITLGTEVKNGDGTDNSAVYQTDLEITGDVVGSGVGPTGQCPIVETVEGVVQVKVLAGESWELAAIWPGGSTGSLAVDILCAVTQQTRTLRLEAQPGATARVDAVTVSRCP